MEERVSREPISASFVTEPTHERAAKVNPREGRSEVLRRELRPKDAVYDHRGANYEDGDLKQCACMALLEQAADDGNAQQIELITTQAGATPLISNWRSNFEPSRIVR